MHAEVAVSTPLPAKPSRWLGGPPGILFYLATACACLFALDANRRGSLVGLLIVAPVWLVIAGVWLVRFVAAATDAGWRLPVAHWLRWLVIPMVMGSVFLVTRTGAVFDARLALSRGALDQMVA